MRRTGAVAQLGERRVRNAKVGSSILLRSTIKSSTLIVSYSREFGTLERRTERVGSGSLVAFAQCTDPMGPFVQAAKIQKANFSSRHIRSVLGREADQACTATQRSG